MKINPFAASAFTWRFWVIHLYWIVLLFGSVCFVFVNHVSWNLLECLILFAKNVSAVVGIAHIYVGRFNILWKNRSLVLKANFKRIKAVFLIRVFLVSKTGETLQGMLTLSGVLVKASTHWCQKSKFSICSSMGYL